MKFGERLKKLRNEKKLTQAELAQLIDVSKTSIANWENGTYETDFDTLISLAKFFSVTTNYLLGVSVEE